MNAKRSFFVRHGLVRSSVPALWILTALAVVGCKDDPAPTPAPEGSSSAASAKKDKDTAKKPTAASKLDPLAVKTYRAESCYFGTLSLRQARAAYMASLGGGEPGEGKIPNFGSATTPEKAPEKSEKIAEKKGEKGDKADKGTPAASSAAAAKAAPSGSAKTAAAAPSGSAAKTAAKSLANRPRPVPYERHARSCTVAAGIKSPAAPGLDEVLAEFAPWAVQLSKDIAAANSYYAKDEHKADSFAKGKELHKKLTDGFAKLDEMQKKLGDSLAKFKDGNKPDASKYSDGQKLANTAVDLARDAMVALVADPADAAKAKEKLDALEKSVAELKKFGDEHKDDAWTRIVAPSLETFHKEAKRVAELPDLKAPPPDDLLQLVTFFTRVLESQNRGLTRQVSGAGVADVMKKRPSLKVPQGGGDH